MENETAPTIVPIVPPASQGGSDSLVPSSSPAKTEGSSTAHTQTSSEPQPNAEVVEAPNTLGKTPDLAKSIQAFRKKRADEKKEAKPAAEEKTGKIDEEEDDKGEKKGKKTSDESTSEDDKGEKKPKTGSDEEEDEFSPLEKDFENANVPKKTRDNFKAATEKAKEYKKQLKEAQDRLKELEGIKKEDGLTSEEREEFNALRQEIRFVSAEKDPGIIKKYSEPINKFTDSVFAELADVPGITKETLAEARKYADEYGVENLNWDKVLEEKDEKGNPIISSQMKKSFIYKKLAEIKDLRGEKKAAIEGFAKDYEENQKKAVEEKKKWGDETVKVWEKAAAEHAQKKYPFLFVKAPVDKRASDEEKAEVEAHNKRVLKNQNFVFSAIATLGAPIGVPKGTKELTPEQQFDLVGKALQYDELKGEYETKISDYESQVEELKEEIKKLNKGKRIAPDSRNNAAPAGAPTKTVGEPVDTVSAMQAWAAQHRAGKK